VNRQDVLLACALLAAYCGLAAWLPLLDDEVYYWCWAQTPQLSYFDHAPLSAYMIWASIQLFGDSALAVRLPAVFASVVVVLVIRRLMTPTWLWPWVVLTPLYTFGAILITPDTPFLLFWSLYFAWLVGIHDRLAPASGAAVRIETWRWCLGGLFLGLGALGKYTMALAVPCTLISFLIAAPRAWRVWLPGYIGHGVVSFVVFLPVVVFNVQRDFVSLRFQWEHAMATDPGEGGVKSFGEFVTVQMALFGLMPFFVWGWGIWNWRKLRETSLHRVAGVFFILPFTFFLYKAWRGPLEGNWALSAYVACWPLAAYWHGQCCPASWRRPVRVVAFGIPFLVVVGLGIHLLSPLPFLPVQRDRISRQWPRLQVVREGVEAAKRDGLKIPIFTPTYQMTALLRYAGGDAQQMEGVSRPSHFTMTPKFFEECEECYVWNENVLPSPLCNGFAAPRLVGSFPMLVRGEVVSGYHLLHYRKLRPGEAPPAPLPLDHRLQQGAEWFLNQPTR
jgi:hypothetical protein